MKILKISFIAIMALIKVTSTQGQIVLNQSFEVPNDIGIYPVSHSEFSKIYHWEDRAIAADGEIYHSPDWYYVDSYFMEEMLPGNSFYTPVYGNTNGYVGMRQCELIQQKLSEDLIKDKYYAISFYIRFLHDDNRVHQDINRTWLNSGTFKIRVGLSKASAFYETSATNCRSPNYCKMDEKEWPNKQYIDFEDIVLNKQNYPPGQWHRISYIFLTKRKNLRHVFLDVQQSGENENCDPYLLIDDIQIYKGCTELEPTCSFSQGTIPPVSCNQSHGSQVPLTFTGISSGITDMFCSIYDLQGSIVHTQNFASCPNGYTNNEVQIQLPFMAANLYYVLMFYINDNNPCLRFYHFYYLDDYFGSYTNNCCRPEGIMKSCCLEEHYTQQYHVQNNCGPPTLYYDAIDNLHVGVTEPFVVNSGDYVYFTAGNSIVFGPQFYAAADATLLAEVKPCEFNPDLRPGDDSGFTNSEMLSIDEIQVEETSNFEVYPNPSNGSFFVKSSFTSDALVSVYDIMGREVLEKVVADASNFEIDLSHLKKGNFIIVLKDNNGKRSQKLVSIR